MDVDKLGEGCVGELHRVQRVVLTFMVTDSQHM